jgi:hypothetical protein
MEGMVSADMENAPAREKHLRKASFSLAVNKDCLGWEKIGRKQFSARNWYVKQFWQEGHFQFWRTFFPLAAHVHMA